MRTLIKVGPIGSGVATGGPGVNRIGKLPVARLTSPRNDLSWSDGCHRSCEMIIRITTNQGLGACT